VDKSYQGHPKTASGQRSSHLNERGRGNPGFRYWGRGRGNATNGQGERRCFTCNAIGHISTHCPNKRGGNNSGHNHQYASGHAQVNFCSTLPCVPESVENVISDECHALVGEKECMSEWEYGVFPIVDATSVSASSQGKIKISPLRFAQVKANGMEVRALSDSGAQIPLISQSLTRDVEQMGRIVIDGVVGSALVPLINVNLQLTAESGTINLYNAELPIVCGVIDLDGKDYDMILPPDVINELQEMPVVSVSVVDCEIAGDSVNVSDAVANDEFMDESVLITSDEVTNAESCDSSVQDEGLMSGDAGKMIDEQRQDETLLTVGKWLVRGKVILLFHVSCYIIKIKSKVKPYVSCVCLLADAMQC